MSAPSADSGGGGMKCHYEVLGVDRKATLEEIVKARRTLSLKLHPDRNHGREQEAKEMFQLVQAAYEVLSNPDERAWYDSHREKILRGGNPHAAGGGVGGDSDDDDGDGPPFLNLWAFFARKAYTKTGDPGEQGFFAVFARVFKAVTEEDAEFDPKAREQYPQFGGDSTPWPEVNRFYSFWQCYSTRKSFAWKDEYRAHDMPDRFQRRAAERINTTARDAARREYSKLVQQLVEHVARNDPRVEREQERVDAEKQRKAEERERREDEVYLRRAEQRRRWQEEAEAEEKARGGRTVAEDLEVLEQLYAMQDRAAAARGGKKGGKKGASSNFHVQPGSVVPEEAKEGGGNAAAGDDDDEPAKVTLRCEPCKKSFGSEKLWKEHCSSTKHKAQLRKLGIDPNAAAPADDGDEEAPSSPADPSDPPASPATPASPPAGKKQAPQPQGKGKKAPGGKPAPPPAQEQPPAQGDDDDDVSVADPNATFNTRKKGKKGAAASPAESKPVVVPKRNKKGQPALKAPTSSDDDGSGSDSGSDGGNIAAPPAKSKFGGFKR